MDFQIREQEFYINGKKEFLLCGEIHYFRIPKENWELVLDRLVECGCNAVAYYVPWHLHEYKEDKFDFNGETEENLDLSAWIELTEKKNLLGFIRIGPYIYAESTDLGVPVWFTKNYPDAHVKGFSEGHYVNTGNVNFASHNHPQFLKAVEKWYEAVCHVIRRHMSPRGNIVMLQLCNEIPGEDVDDRNPVTLGIGKENGLLPSYLKAKYGTAEVLSEAYGAEFKDLCTVEPHHLESANRELAENEHLEFYYDYYYPAYFRTLRSFAEKNGIQTTFTHNAYNPRALSLHYGNKKKNPWICMSVDCYYSLNGSLDMKSATYFCEFGAEYMKNFLHCTPWVAEQESGYWLDEPKIYGPELYIFNIWTMAAGYRGINMFLFAGGKNRIGQGFYGTDHNWQAPVTLEGARTERFYGIRDSLIHMKKDKDIFQESLRYDIALGIKKDPGLIWKPTAKNGDGTFYQLKKAGFTPKILDFQTEPLEVLQKEPCLWIVSDEEMDREIQEKLLDYVSCGGKLIIGGRIPLKDRRRNPCKVLAEALGIRAEECPQADEDQQKAVWGDEEYDIGYNVQPIQVREECIVARERHGKPCAALQSYGEGQVLILPFAQQTRLYSSAQFVLRAAALLGIEPKVEQAQNLRILPKKGGKSIALNLHPVHMKETVRICKKEYTISLEPYSYVIIEERFR
ncbi:MAG: beta-galactosidase [Eubacteriales bacterium]|nr:beta-galactosidase [Eubacteriales bacterium]